MALACTSLVRVRRDTLLVLLGDACTFVPQLSELFLWIRDLSHTAKISNIFVWFICLLIFLIFSIQTLGDLFLFVFVFVLQRNLSLFSSVALGFSRAARPVPAPRLRKHPPRWPLTCVYLSVVRADHPPRREKRLQHYLLAPTLFHLKDAGGRDCGA